LPFAGTGEVFLQAASLQTFELAERSVFVSNRKPGDLLLSFSFAASLWNYIKWIRSHVRREYRSSVSVSPLLTCGLVQLLRAFVFKNASIN
jgi:hypothetical protein